jgi:hypothetical protein
MKPSELSTIDLLMQLCEESAELCQATAKFVRLVRGTNPSPHTPDDYLPHLVEEMADVQCAMDALFEQKPHIKGLVDEMCDAKMQRWTERLSQ